MERSVTGQDFDAADIGDDVAHLVIHQIRKGDLKRLRGLADLRIRVLELRWLSAPDLTAVPLPVTLRALDIWQSPKLKSCAGITQAPALQSLRWSENGPIEDGRALGQLPELRVLRIETGVEAKQKLVDLEFLRGLQLDELRLNGVGPHDLDIAPLLALGGLKRIALHGTDWDEDSLAAIAARFPAVHADIHTLENYPADMGMRCIRCGGVRKMLRIRKRKFLWCADCDAKGLEKVLAGFDARVEVARQSNTQGVSDAQIA